MVGEKVTTSATDDPGATVAEVGFTTSSGPTPAIVALKTDRLAVPMLETVTCPDVDDCT